MHPSRPFPSAHSALDDSESHVARQSMSVPIPPKSDIDPIPSFNLPLNRETAQPAPGTTLAQPEPIDQPVDFEWAFLEWLASMEPPSSPVRAVRTDASHSHFEAAAAAAAAPHTVVTAMTGVSQPFDTSPFTAPSSVLGSVPGSLERAPAPLAPPPLATAGELFADGSRRGAVPILPGTPHPVDARGQFFAPPAQLSEAQKKNMDEKWLKDRKSQLVRCMQPEAPMSARDIPELMRESSIEDMVEKIEQAVTFMVQEKKLQLRNMLKELSSPNLNLKVNSSSRESSVSRLKKDFTREGYKSVLKLLLQHMMEKEQR